MLGAKSKPGIAVSATVAISGASEERFSEFTAMSFSLPSFTKPAIEGIADHTAVTWPLTSAGIDCPVPLNGTCSRSMPSVPLIDSIVRWWMLPMPEEPYV